MLRGADNMPKGKRIRAREQLPNTEDNARSTAAVRKFMAKRCPLKKFDNEPVSEFNQGRRD